MTNKVLRTRVVVFMESSLRAQTWRRASERRMNPFSVRQFSVDGFGRSRWRGRPRVAARSNCNRVANDRAAHAVLAEVAVFECRRGATVALQVDPDFRLLLGRKT